MNATYLKAPTLYRDHLAHRAGWQYWTVNPEVRATIITLKSDDEFLVFSKEPTTAHRRPTRQWST